MHQKRNKRNQKKVKQKLLWQIDKKSFSFIIVISFNNVHKYRILFFFNAIFLFLLLLSFQFL